MANKDYYKTLGVEKGATDEAIKKAYRKLAHEYHPDKATGNEAKFKEINEAYQVLKDTDKRQKYDQYGTSFDDMGGWGGANWEDVMRGFRQGSGGGQSAGFDFGNQSGFSFDLGDIFSEFFGGRSSAGAGGRSTRRRSRGRDIETTIEIDFKESVFGVEKNIKMDKLDRCTVCHGNRAEPGTPIVECAQCGGRGQVQVTRQSFLGVISSTAVCPQCQGDGKIAKKKCAHCNGEGLERVAKTIKIKIPAGIANGESIRITGEGEVSDDLSSAGDLYVRLRVSGHYKFKRQADDIYSVEPITFTQAVLGGKIWVDTLDGKVNLKIPVGTASDTVFKLKKKGVPHLRTYGQGDHLVTVKIVVPEKLSRKGRKLLEELQGEGL